MRKFILAFFLIPLYVSAQNGISTTGTANQLSQMKGGLIMDSLSRIPVRGFGPIYPLVPYQGRIQISSLNAFPYYHNGIDWVNMMDFKNLTNRPALYPPDVHTQPATSIIGLNDSLSKYQLKGSYNETDPTVPAYVKGINASFFVNGNTAYSWGNHAGLYKPIGYVPTWDDVINKPTAFTPIAHTHLQKDVSGLPVRLDSIITAVAGKQVSGTYVSTEIDPSVPTPVKAITSTNISNWNSAYGWGNHALAGYRLNTVSISYLDLTNRPTVKRQETYSGTTNASGMYMVTFTTPYTSAPNVQVVIPNQTTANQTARVSSVSTTGFTINVYQRNSVTLLSTEVLLAAVVNVASVNVDVLVTEK